MKAYAVEDKHSNHAVIVWTDDVSEAKKLSRFELPESEFIDLIVKRLPEADALYYGKSYADWCSKAGQQIYYDLEYWLEDGRECEACGMYEFDKIPESMVNEEGLCVGCAGYEAGR